MKDLDGIYSYHVLGENLELTLFDNTESYLEILIHAKCLKEKDYEQFTKKL